MNFKDTKISTLIPTKIVGPIHINYDGNVELIDVPLATFELPIWHSTKRGALVSQKTSGINVFVTEDIMTRSIVLEALSLEIAINCSKWIKANEKQINTVINSTSRFAALKSIHIENVGRLLYVRLSMETGNASGHNITTKAADAVAIFVVSNFENIKYVSVSGNYCTDKKNSSVNGILGRGKRVSAEILVPRDVCETILKTTPEKIVDLNVKKNFVGSILSGGVRSANAHFANVVLALYLATGQDAANIVEASQGITFADTDDGNLYFSVTIPNIIVGTVGNGKNYEFALSNLDIVKCDPSDQKSAKRLSAIIAATALCSELSLIAAQTVEGELVKAHMELERGFHADAS